MIVQKITVRIKPGKIQEALEIAKEAKRRWPAPGRLYHSIYGTVNTVVFENEAENAAGIERFWEELRADEEWPIWQAKWRELVTGESTNELWNLVDY